MSLALPLKLFARLEEARIECPEVLSMSQVLRVVSLFGVLGLALALFEISSIAGVFS